MLLFSVFLWAAWGSLSGVNLHTVADGKIYRCNRLSPSELDEIIVRQKIRTVICLEPAAANEVRFQQQQAVCNQRHVLLCTMEFDEFQVPSSADMQQLQDALKNAAQPVLLVGGKRSPTLSGFGSAVALMMEEGPPEQALSQLGWRYFQLEGPEHCIVARPLREYRDWLLVQGVDHSAFTFCQWTERFQATPEDLTKARKKQPSWQAMLGAPRYPRRF